MAGTRQNQNDASNPLLDRAHKLVDRLFMKVDWARLGEVYCDEGGDAFWVVRRGPARRAGIEWGRAAVDHLAEGGRSLWVGAGVAELGAIVHEVVVLRRTVVATNLRAVECETLAAAIQEVGLAEHVRFVGEDVRTLLEREPGPYDHIGMVSVATDPETYPQVSGVSYGRLHPVFVDIDAFAAEREQVRDLVRATMAALGVDPGAGAVVTTTFEEVAWILEWAETRPELAVEAADVELESPVVGDPVGFLLVRAGATS